MKAIDKIEANGLLDTFNQGGLVIVRHAKIKEIKAGEYDAIYSNGPGLGADSYLYVVQIQPETEISEEDRVFVITEEGFDKAKKSMWMQRKAMNDEKK